MLFTCLAANAQLVARFSGTNLSGCAPILTSFTDESAGNPNAWKWDLGNGTVSYLQNPSVTYFVPGTYNVKLVIRNAAGQDSITKAAYVHVYAPPVVDFVASQTSGCDLVNARFTDLSNAANSWQWDFGDGIFSSEHNPAHTYSQGGNYNVSLKVLNGDGCSFTLVKQAYINVHKATAGFTYRIPNRCIPTSVQFQNTSAGNGRLQYKWFFGNGDTAASINPIYNYALAGTYTVKLVASNEFGCVDSFLQTVTVAAPVNASFNADITGSCVAPVSIRFTNQMLPGNNYTWDFGDTTYTSIPNPVHIYRDTGSYTVKLIIRNSNGCVDSVIKNNYINIQKPFASVKNLPDSGCTGMTKQLTALSKGSDSIVAYRWDFGDGASSTVKTPTHIFSGDRYFTVSLITTGLSGCKDTLIMPAAIRTGIKPVADFSAEVLEACAQSRISFFDRTIGNVTQWQWNFGDNGQAFEQNPAYRFTDTGHLAAELIAFNGGCADTATRYRYVYIKPSVAKFKFDFNCENPYRFTFTNLALGADEWIWNFGDGITSTERHPVHVYSDTGAYLVSLSTINNSTGCNGYKGKEVVTTEVLPSFFASDTIVCKGNSIVFTATINSDEVNRFLWDFGDGSVEASLENFITHEYREPGDYTVKLITLNKVNCRDSVVKTNYISVKKVTANFGIPVTVVCTGQSVQFTDSTVVSPGSHITRWHWYYGDGQTDTLTAAPFSHSYAAKGNYAVTLTAIDNNGCTGTFTAPVSVTVKTAWASFRPEDSVKCTNTEMRFICPFNEPGVTYQWDFGDGETSDRQIPRHSYAVEGSYYVKLKVSLIEGCADSFALEHPVTIEDPVAKFTISDSFRSCPPLIVEFDNNSQKTVDEWWNFGYGTSIHASDPSHFYSYPGIYTASLTVSGRGGCTRSMSRTIEVKGPKGSLQYGPLNFCQAPASVTFTALTTDATSFTWDFNDGSTVNNSDSIVTHLYTNSGRYTPKLMLVDNEGCRVPVQGTDTIYFTKLKAGFRFADTNTCNNGYISFIDASVSAGNIVSYNWRFGDGTQENNLMNPSHHYVAEGTYYPKLHVVTADGCIDSFTATVPVTVALLPDIAINPSLDSGCSPLHVSLDGINNSAHTMVTSWQWDFGNGNTSSRQNAEEQLYTVPGIYSVSLTATGVNGCKATTQRNIIVHAPPTVVISGATTICKDGSTTLTASGAQSYEWASSAGALSCTSCSSITVAPASATLFTVIATNGNGCLSYDTVPVRVVQPFVLTYSDSVKVCAGNKVQLNVAGAEMYEWIPSAGLENNLTSSPTTQANESVQYKVIGRDSNGCYADTGFVNLVVQQVPQVYAGADRQVAPGTTIELIPVVSPDVREVVWSPTGDVFRNADYAIVVKPYMNTEYTVTARNVSGCTSTDKINIAVANANLHGGLFVPNTFSPNGDGANDIFYPRAGSNIKVNRLKILNRHGVIVFEKANFYTNDVTAGWDGKVRGSRQPVDVYVYALEIVESNGKTKLLSGNISLIY